MKFFRYSALAILAASLFGLPACEPTVEEDTASTPPTSPERAVTTQFELRTRMRELWTDHAAWTRFFLIGTLADFSDAPQAMERLLETQQAIGDSIKQFYGREAGDDLSRLLRAHVMSTADVARAAKEGNTAQLAGAKRTLGENANEIAVFLAETNPALDVRTVGSVMRRLVDRTVAQITERLGKDWDEDVAAHEEVVTASLAMADILSNGIADQFPGRVLALSGLTTGSKQLHLRMRKLWEDHVMWTRVFLLDEIDGLPDSGATAARLLQNDTEIAKVVTPFYGQAVAAELAELLEGHFELAAAFVAALKAGDVPATAAASTSWYANADAIAELFVSQNPYLAQDSVRSMMRTHLDATLAEARAHYQGNWSDDIQAFDDASRNAARMADALSGGLADQFPERVNPVNPVGRGR